MTETPPVRELCTPSDSQLVWPLAAAATALVVAKSTYIVFIVGGVSVPALHTRQILIKLGVDEEDMEDASRYYAAAGDQEVRWCDMPMQS